MSTIEGVLVVYGIPDAQSQIITREAAVKAVHELYQRGRVLSYSVVGNEQTGQIYGKVWATYTHEQGYHIPSLPNIDRAKEVREETMKNFEAKRDALITLMSLVREDVEETPEQLWPIIPPTVHYLVDAYNNLYQWYLSIGAPNGEGRDKLAAWLKTMQSEEKP